MSRHYGLGQDILRCSYDRRRYSRKSRREIGNVKHVAQVDVEPTIDVDDFSGLEALIVGASAEQRELERAGRRISTNSSTLF